MQVLYVTGRDRRRSTITADAGGTLMGTQTTPPAAVVCQVCGSKTGDTGLLCRVHGARLTTELREVPGLLLELEVTVCRSDRVSVGAEVGVSAERSLPWNEHAAHLRDVLLGTLDAWGVAVATLPAGAAAAVRELRTTADAGDGYEELLDAIRGVRQVIDRPDAATRFYAGPCPETVDVPRETADAGNPGADPGVPCSGEVWAFIPTETDTPAMLRCRTCKTGWGTAQWLRVGQRMLARMAQLK